MSIKLIPQTDQDNNPEPWLAQVIISEQRIFDGNYNSALADYATQCSRWVITNDQNQTIGQPITPKPTVPRKQIAYANSRISWSSYLAEPDPDIAVPILPPFVPAGNNQAPFTTGAPATTDQELGLLQQIAKDVAAIKAFMHIS